MAKVELKTVKQLLDKKFFVPLYQRGYRWDKQQVDDLLKDIDDFSTRNGFADSFYCLQPLAVRENVSDKDEFVKALRGAGESESAKLLSETRKAIADNIRWEVIDGQQRLTTIYLILAFLDKPPFEIKFARGLELAKETRDATADYHHVGVAKEVISGFFKNKDDPSKKKFLDTLKEKVQFIWYEVDEEDPVKVFTRLNIGKIALTNSELIKALFLNRSNFIGGDSEKIRLRQTEIAGRWDEIEATLQDEEFWMFIHEKDFDKPTRIDFIFDLICKMEQLDEYIPALKDDKDKRIGEDKFRTFRYFNEYFRLGKALGAAENTMLIDRCWQKVDEVFAAFREWFNDLTMYHYVGFLVACKNKNQLDVVQEILALWNTKNANKSLFVFNLKAKIKETITGCCNLNKRYEDGGENKTILRPLLLLHNVQTVLNQHADEAARYGMATFYKFPFHLFKSESWNVEHIDSNTENSLKNENDQKEWLKSTYCFLLTEEDEGRVLRNQILKYFNRGDEDDPGISFGDLYSDVGRYLQTRLGDADKNRLDDDGKNKIGNFTLLDETTNKSYGNAIFPVKRRILMGKSQGIQYKLEDKRNEKGEITEFKMEAVRQDDSTDTKRRTSFVPPVTLRVFLKAYNPISGNPWVWGKTDADTYCRNICETLREFGVILK